MSELFGDSQEFSEFKNPLSKNYDIKTAVSSLPADKISAPQPLKEEKLSLDADSLTPAEIAQLQQQENQAAAESLNSLSLDSDELP